MQRITLPAPVPRELLLPSPEPRTLTLAEPTARVLTLTGPADRKLVLSADLVPQVPGLAAGTVEGAATISGVVTSVRTSAAGTVAGTGSMTGTAKAKASASGTVSGSASITAQAKAKLPGTVTGSASIIGIAQPRLAGSATGSASITGIARPVLSGLISGAASVTGTASARAYASGAVAGEALITGQAQVRWTDNFDRLSAPIGTNWITSSLSPFIYSGAAQCPATSTSTSVWALTTIDLGSDDQSVTALIVAPTTPPASEESGLALRSGSAWATGTHAELAFSTGKGCSIKSVVNGAATVRASTTTNISYGDTLEFRAVGNVYTAYRNGSSFLTWTDSGNIVAVGPSRRRFGFYAAGIKTDKVYFTPAIDWIAGQDL